ncbi:hypothetical protein WDZ92_13585 [Nostoc sp. NIES-2111]
MFRIATALVLLGSTAAFAQGMDGTPHQHGQGQMMNHSEMMQPGTMQNGMMQHGVGIAPTQAGQAAFATIQEIVQILEADPATDWSKVDIEALRQHLIDMDNVTLRAVVQSTPVEGGVRFTVTGTGEVRDSIRRMVTAHAATMSGVGGWGYASAEVADGASLTVTVPAQDIPKLKALGFIGVMTVGMHHQAHHLMLARGMDPHR